MRGFWFILRTDLGRLLSRRETFLWAVLLPPVFFYFIGTVTGGGMAALVGLDLDDAPLTLHTVPSGGFLQDELSDRLSGAGFLVTEPTGDAEEGEELQLLVPDSLTENVLSGAGARLQFVGRANAPPADLSELTLARTVYGLLADVVLLQASDAALTQEGLAAVSTGPRNIGLTVRPAGLRATTPTGFDQAIPGILVMFTMLVLLTGGASLVVIEREEGLLRRLASAPVSRSSLVGGKWAALMALALFQVAMALAFGTWLFDFDWGDSLPMVYGLLVAWAAVNASMALTLGNLVKTQVQMQAVGLIVTMLLAGLGGCWWAIEVTPEWMQTLALFLPSGLTMDGLHELVSFASPAPTVLPHLGGLVAVSVLLGFTAVRTFRYE